MVFLTLALFTYHLITLFKGKLFYTNFVTIGETKIKVAQGEVSETDANQQLMKVVWQPLIFVAIWFSLMIGYLMAALTIDPYKLPTIAVVMYFIVTLVIAAVSRKDKLDTEADIFRYKSKLYQKHTVKGFLYKAASIGYFGYMFYVLVFGL